LALRRLDEQMIESLFGYNAAARCSAAKLEEGQSRSPSLGHHVLDPKRLQNITILMKAVNATADQIYAALLQGTVTNELLYARNNTSLIFVSILFYMVLSGGFRERPVGAAAGGTDQDGADQGRGREARELRRRRRQPGRGGKAPQGGAHDTVRVRARRGHAVPGDLRR